MDKRNNDFDFDFKPIGQAIKAARKAQGMTREQLSRIVDYDPRHLQAIENEGQYPSLELFIQLAFFATTTSLPFCAEYSQVERVMSLSPYLAVTPVSYKARGFNYVKKTQQEIQQLFFLVTVNFIVHYLHKF